MKIFEREMHRRARQRAMSLAEFCERYGPGRTEAYEELKSGRLRGRKIDRRTVITEEDAEEWLRHLPLIEGRTMTERAIGKRHDAWLRDGSDG